MKRSLSRLIKFPVVQKTRTSTVTLYAEGSRWRIELARLDDGAGDTDIYLPVEALEIDWEEGLCRRREKSPRPEPYSPATLMDLTTLPGTPLLAEGVRLGTVVDGVLEEDDLRLQALIIAREKHATPDSTLISTEWVRWIPGETGRCIVCLPPEKAVAILENNAFDAGTPDP